MKAVEYTLFEVQVQLPEIILHAQQHRRFVRLPNGLGQQKRVTVAEQTGGPLHEVGGLLHVVRLVVPRGPTDAGDGSNGRRKPFLLPLQGFDCGAKFHLPFLEAVNLIARFTETVGIPPQVVELFLQGVASLRKILDLLRQCFERLLELRPAPGELINLEGSAQTLVPLVLDVVQFFQQHVAPMAQLLELFRQVLGLLALIL